MDDEEKAADTSIPVIIQTESPRQISKAGGAPPEESKEKPSNPAASQVLQGNGLDGDNSKPAAVMTDSHSQ